MRCDEPPPFGDALQGLEDALKDGIRGFAKWYSEEWKITREQWGKDFAEPPPDGDWFDGYNAGCEAILGAVEHYLDEVR